MSCPSAQWYSWPHLGRHADEPQCQILALLALSMRQPSFLSRWSCAWNQPLPWPGSSSAWWYPGSSEFRWTDVVCLCGRQDSLGISGRSGVGQFQQSCGLSQLCKPDLEAFSNQPSWIQFLQTCVPDLSSTLVHSMSSGRLSSCRSRWNDVHAQQNRQAHLDSWCRTDFSEFPQTYDPFEYQTRGSLGFWGHGPASQCLGTRDDGQQTDTLVQPDPSRCQSSQLPRWTDVWSQHFRGQGSSFAWLYRGSWGFRCTDELCRSCTQDSLRSSGQSAASQSIKI